MQRPQWQARADQQDQPQPSHSLVLPQAFSLTGEAATELGQDHPGVHLKAVNLFLQPCPTPVNLLWFSWCLPGRTMNWVFLSPHTLIHLQTPVWQPLQLQPPWAIQCAGGRAAMGLMRGEQPWTRWLKSSHLDHSISAHTMLDQHFKVKSKSFYCLSFNIALFVALRNIAQRHTFIARFWKVPLTVFCQDEGCCFGWWGQGDRPDINGGKSGKRLVSHS